MSLDNILAVGGAAHGDVPLLLFGLGLSIPLILFGSSLVVAVMNRLPWLVYVGAAILVYTAVEMLLDDPVLRPYYPHAAWFEWGTILVVMLGILGLGYWRNAGHSARRPAPEISLTAGLAAPVTPRGAQHAKRRWRRAQSPGQR